MALTYEEHNGITVCPVYRTELDPFVENSYRTITEAEVVCLGLRDLGTIKVGQPVEDEMNRFDLGAVTTECTSTMRFGIIAIEHILPVSLEGIVEQGEPGPANRPYDEDPVSLRAIGISGIDLFCLAGFYYKTNRYAGRLEIHRKQPARLSLLG